MRERTFVLGDIHGAAKALEQVLERSKFQRGTDTLIFIGDVADGWPETRQAIDILLDIPNLIHILGNHDEWFGDWLKTGRREPIWTSQGGQATIDSYGTLDDVPQSHINYIESAVLWHEDRKNNRIFVHGGWDYIYATHPKQSHPDVLNWDRYLWMDAQRVQKNLESYNSKDTDPRTLTDFDEVYIGHTSTSAYSLVPMQACEVWNLDQGAGWSGKLSIMDIDTKEYWQSGFVKNLYPDVQGRY